MSTRARTSLSTPYVAVWVLLTTVAVAYMGAMAVKPELVAGAVPRIHIGSLLLDEDDTELRRQAFEAETLRRQLFSARAELNGLRGEVARRTDRETTLTLKLASLEAEEARAAELAANEAARKPPVRTAEKRPLPPKPMSAVERLAAKVNSGREAGNAFPAGVQFAAPPTATRTATGGAPDAIETGSVADASPAEATAGIQLGTGPSVDALRLNWTLLQQRHGGALQRLQPRYMSSRGAAPGAQGQAFDLIAGPLPPAEAQRTCDALRARNVACKVGGFGGNAL